MALSSTSTRQVYGFDFGNFPSSLGGGRPPFVDGNINGTGNFVPDLDAIKAAGGRALLKFTGPSSNAQVLTTTTINGTPTSVTSFSMGSWKHQMDLAANHATAAKMKSYITSGALIGHYMMDDLKSGNPVFFFGPNYDDLEEMARYSKSYWPDVPCCVRAEDNYLEGLARSASKSSYSWLDFGWAQWVARFGPVDTYFANHINAGKRMRLGALVGFNLVNGGSGKTAPWNIHPGSSHQTGMSPMELDAVGAAYTAHINEVIGLMGWSANPTFDPDNYYGSYVSIPEALTRLANRAIGQLAGPFNTHNVTSSTSSSAATVVGDWAVRDAGTHFRSNDPSAPAVPLPACNAGDLLCILTYSRDSGRSTTTPSDMSEARRISGTSAQGGELCLFTKIAAGNEGGTTKTLARTGSATNTAFQAQAFSFSGNTTKMGTLVAATSSSSWGRGSSDMGPVKGIPVASLSSDCMILICAAKTNDFNNGDHPDFNTMSSTTADSESWNRLLMSTNGSGDDSGMFADYAFLNGKQSITTKSWTQSTVSGAGSSASGSGCGFMVAFVPTLVASVQSTLPVLAEISPLEDVALSLGDTLTFTLLASGTTPITYSAVSAPSNFTVGSSTGVCQWSPSASGTYFIVVAAANSAGTDTDDFIAVVSTTTVNHAPLITNPGDKTVLVQERTTFTVAATDQDGDSLAYTLDGGSAAGATIDSVTGFFDYTPQAAGAYPVVVVVSDGRLESRSTFTFTVSDQPTGGGTWTKVLGPHLGPPGNQFRRL